MEFGLEIGVLGLEVVDDDLVLAMDFGLVVLATAQKVLLILFNKLLGVLVKEGDVLVRALADGVPFLLVQQALDQLVQVVAFLGHQ